jgi:hypothetical protein
VKKLLLATVTVLGLFSTARAEPDHTPTYRMTCSGLMAVNDEVTPLRVTIVRGKEPSCVAYGKLAERIRNGCSMDSRCTVKGEGYDWGLDGEEFTKINSIEAEVR